MSLRLAPMTYQYCNSIGKDQLQALPAVAYALQLSNMHLPL